MLGFMRTVFVFSRKNERLITICQKYYFKIDVRKTALLEW